ncbi:MAG: hypothetical protein K0Q55_1298 [Verrucomicrobia bacterium]|nr:hypothetical protein [Verrucomicrobiota bacterium]
MKTENDGEDGKDEILCSCTSYSERKANGSGDLLAEWGRMTIRSGLKMVVSGCGDDRIATAVVVWLGGGGGPWFGRDGVLPYREESRTRTI